VCLQLVAATAAGAPTTGGGYGWVRLQLMAATAGCAYNRWRLQLGAPRTGGG
jgi:hypothetical protein